MKKPKIKVSITKEITGYSASAIIGNDFIGTEGESYDELKLNILESINFTFKEEGFVYSIEEIIFTLDLQSFFDFYKVLNAKALSNRIGMNQSLLAQYISGKKKPSANQTQRILEGVRQIGRELAEIRFFI
jgi:transcriptional regulator with XRE-family HTH domain